MEAKNQMKALIFDPYLDTLGGGERYVGGVSQTLVKKGYEITFAWPVDDFLKKMEDRFGIVLKNIKVDSSAYNLFKKPGGIVQKFFLTKKYDLIFWVSDGSLPFLFSKNNLVHFQVPFLKDPESNPLIKSLKTSLINKFIYNSEFTRNILEKHFPKTKGLIFYPPIDIDSFKNSSVKDNIILSVGRFDSPSHPKRFDVIIRAFKLLYGKNKDYRLIIAGGLKGDFGENSLKELKIQAQNYPVNFITNSSHRELVKLYAKSKIYWHAAGYDIDEETSPEQVEHFGISTVEAMASGCVPVVINKGGQKEIVTGKSGFLWDTIKELVNHTLTVISDDKLCRKLSKGAIKRSKKFSIERFYHMFSSI